MSLALVLAFLLPILLDTLEKLFDVGCSGEIFCIRSGRKLFSTKSAIGQEIHLCQFWQSSVLNVPFSVPKHTSLTLLEGV